MKTLDRQSVLLALIEGLRARDTLTKVPVVQKATYFLQELTSVPLGFCYVFHKYGPYSFDLQDEITAMQADLVLDLELQREHGPCLAPGEMSHFLNKRGRSTIACYSPQIQFIVGKVADMKMDDVDRLSAALYVWVQGGTERTHAATRLSELKPRVSISEASAALEEVIKIRKEAPASGPQAATTCL
jgi:hypothetical protein